MGGTWGFSCAPARGGGRIRRGRGLDKAGPGGMDEGGLEDERSISWGNAND